MKKIFLILCALFTICSCSAINTAFDIIDILDEPSYICKGEVLHITRGKDKTIVQLSDGSYEILDYLSISKGDNVGIYMEDGEYKLEEID